QDAAKAGAQLPAAVPFVEGLILHKQRRFSEALVKLREAEQLAAGLPGHTLPELQFYLADVLAREGNEQEAEAHFLQELRLYPGNLNAVRLLCALYRAQGRFGESDEVLQQFGREHPPPQIASTIAAAYHGF